MTCKNRCRYSRTRVNICRRLEKLGHTSGVSGGLSPSAVAFGGSSAAEPLSPVAKQEWQSKIAPPCRSSAKMTFDIVCLSVCLSVSCRGCGLSGRINSWCKLPEEIRYYPQNFSHAKAMCKASLPQQRDRPSDG